MPKTLAKVSLYVGGPSERVPGASYCVATWRRMFKYALVASNLGPTAADEMLLPPLAANTSPLGENFTKRAHKHQSNSSSNSSTSPSSSSYSNSSSSSHEQKRSPKHHHHQGRASNKEKGPLEVRQLGSELVGASLAAGAALPLMIGNRSRLVVNQLLGGAGKKMDQDSSGEQRPVNRSKQEMVSVVRPINRVDELATRECPRCQRDNQRAPSLQLVRGRLEELSIWPNEKQKEQQPGLTASSLLDELMELEMVASRKRQAANEWPLAEHWPEKEPTPGAPPNSEAHWRQQQIFLRREQHELDRAIRRQHKFVLDKLEERRRHLAIVLAVWRQRDLRQAVEKLLELHSQGLMFVPSETGRAGESMLNRQPASRLNSTNGALLVDFLNVLLLRPKLWSLEICQMLLPIVTSELLAPEVDPANSPASGQQNQMASQQLEVALKTIRMVLLQFGPTIRANLESRKQAGRLLAGVDLSREERINRCLACQRLLDEARRQVCAQLARKQPAESRLGSQLRELRELFEQSQLFSNE